MMARTEVLTIESLERLNNSSNGNPRYKVTFTNGREALTETDGQVGYGLENEEYRDVPLEVTFTRAGRVQYVKPANS